MCRVAESETSACVGRWSKATVEVRDDSRRAERREDERSGAKRSEMKQYVLHIPYLSTYLTYRSINHYMALNLGNLPAVPPGRYASVSSQVLDMRPSWVLARYDMVFRLGFYYGFHSDWGRRTREH